MSFLLQIGGLILSSIGSILLGWIVIQPKVWINEKKRVVKKIDALLIASTDAGRAYPNDPVKSAELTNRMAYECLEDLKIRSAQVAGYWAVFFIIFGLIIQIIGLFLDKCN
jgi:hypothetical protein